MLTNRYSELMPSVAAGYSSPQSPAAKAGEMKAGDAQGHRDRLHGGAEGPFLPLATLVSRGNKGRGEAADR